ncbi:hypothetical protein BDN72DRAFT_847843 [Pluteus cervinus]|uniref:Uncharacterized protein n=1 Tax=Pluteus cervinus TaxID=181527 RepID=A0ACD3AC87_9AGAR|nr:hypothetical protein BDN72DRAFT_847843 [Pluteus cervinus]
MSDPRLPPELEHNIFLAAFQSNFRDVGNLILTAKRVHDWILPRAFEVVILGGGRDFPVRFTLDKFQKYGSYIRSLSAQPRILMGSDMCDFPEFLSHCPNITNLYIHTPYFYVDPTPIQNSLAVLPLTRLTVHTKFILSTPPPPQLLQLFTKITHLHLDGDLFSTYAPNNNPPYLRPLFANLTHISFLHPQSCESIRLAIEGWNELRVVVLWHARTYSNQPRHGRMKRGNFHPRLLGVQSNQLRQWEDGARGRGPDLWEYSENIIQSWMEDESRVIFWVGGE